MTTRTATKKIDVDSHFFPRVDYQELKDLLPKAQLHEVQDMLWRDALRFADPQGIRATLSGQEVRPEAPQSDPHRDPEERVKRMRQLGFDMQILIPDGLFFSPGSHPFGGSPSGGDKPFEIRLALCRLYNNAAAAAQRQFPDHLIGTAITPFDRVDEACQELVRAAKELGLRAVIIPGNWLGKNFDTLELYPFWRTVSDLDLTCFVHGIPQGCGGNVVDHVPRYPMVGMERMHRLHIGTYIGFGLDYVIACAALTLGGVLDEFPNLRFCFFEAGASWFLYAMVGCDRAFYIEPQCSRTSQRPSELLRKHCLTAVEGLDPIAELVAALGSENFFIGSDFPHPEYQVLPNTVEGIEKNPGLSERDKENILGGNIARVLKLS